MTSSAERRVMAPDERRRARLTGVMASADGAPTAAIFGAADGVNAD